MAKSRNARTSMITAPKRDRPVKKWRVAEFSHDAWPNDWVDVMVCPVARDYWLVCPHVGQMEDAEFDRLRRRWEAAISAARGGDVTVWEPIITVARMRPHHGESGDFVGFAQLARCYRAVVRGEKALHDWQVGFSKPQPRDIVLYRAWDEAEGAAPTAAHNGGQWNTKAFVPVYNAQILPYDDQAWMVLTSAAGTLRDLKAQLDDLFSQGAEAIVAQLTKQGNLMLTTREG